ncbi:MAG: AMP-binding protein [Myxococcota bacterium]
MTGGAAVPVELVRRMRSDLHFRDVITAYGLTESSGTVSCCRLDDDDETIATTAGRPIPDTETKCVDAEGNEVRAASPGRSGPAATTSCRATSTIRRRPPPRRSTPRAGSTRAISA